jgi:hypothetical protein
MATNQEVMAELAKQTGPASRDEIAKAMGCKVNDIATPLKRLTEKDPPLVTTNDEGNYSLTDAGRKELNPVTEESAGITEFQEFLKFGKAVGVSPDIAQLTADHVWRAGDPNNLEWVLTGLTEQGIRKDLRERWFHLWRGYLHQPTSPAMQELLKRNKENDDTTPAVVTDSKEAVKGSTRLRDYIIDGNNNLLYVGEGNGDYEYLDALKITTLREARAARIPVAGAEGAGVKSSPINDAKDLLMAVNELNGGNGKRKTVMLIPNEEGGYTLQEIEAGSTVSIPRSGGVAAAPKGFFIDPETNEVKEIDPMKPTIIIKNAPAPQGDRQLAVTKNYLYKEDGSMVEIEAGKPIIIHEAAKNSGSTSMLNAVTPDGKSIVIDIDSYFKLEDHKAKIQREQESHEMKMDFMKTVKDFASKGVKALGHMTPESEEE